MNYYRDDDEYDREQAYRDQVRQVYANVVPFPKAQSVIESCDRAETEMQNAIDDYAQRLIEEWSK